MIAVVAAFTIELSGEQNTDLFLRFLTCWTKNPTFQLYVSMLTDNNKIMLDVM